MAIRYIKIILVVFVGLQAWLYLAANIANWNAGLGAVGYVLSMEGNEFYSAQIFPSVRHPVLVSIAFLIILLGEFLVGALSFKGAHDLWKFRKAGPDAFHIAKKYAILGAAMTLVVWFGGFIVIGGALFQMWQSEVGGGSFDGAFVYSVMGGFVLLFLMQRDE